MKHYRFAITVTDLILSLMMMPLTGIFSENIAIISTVGMINLMSFVGCAKKSDVNQLTSTREKAPPYPHQCRKFTTI